MPTLATHLWIHLHIEKYIHTGICLSKCKSIGLSLNVFPLLSWPFTELSRIIYLWQALFCWIVLLSPSMLLNINTILISIFKNHSIYSTSSDIQSKEYHIDVNKFFQGLLGRKTLSLHCTHIFQNDLKENYNCRQKGFNRKNLVEVSFFCSLRFFWFFPNFLLLFFCKQTKVLNHHDIQICVICTYEWIHFQ